MLGRRTLKFEIEFQSPDKTEYTKDKKGDNFVTKNQIVARKYESLSKLKN